MFQKDIDKAFRIFCKILENYNCANCDAICCKYSPIGLEKDEYQKILSSIDQNYREILESKAEPAYDIGYFKQLRPVCPLLNKNKCDIYKHRPMVCQRYPFEFTNTYDIVIRPCSLGIDLILDYMCWSGYISEAHIIYNELLAYKDSRMPITKFVIGPLKYGTGILKKFNRYLNSTIPEERKHTREELIKKIKS